MDLSKFVPPRCPNRSCSNHLCPRPKFFLRHGSYTVLCRSHRIPRFRCKDCRKTFGYQTFRADYRDQRPELNAVILERHTGGQSLRRLAMDLHIDIHGIQKKARKLARHGRDLDANFLLKLPEGRTFLLDEAETFEQDHIRPLTVPVLVEKQSGMVITCGVAPIRRLARKGSPRRKRQERLEQVEGKRKDGSRACVRGVLQTLANLLQDRHCTLRTDEKAMYATLIRKLFADRATHRTTPSRAPRNTFNPLFPINHTLARFRDLGSRLHRRSWCVSKKAAGLETQLELLRLYRNYIRRRTNGEAAHRTPAWHLGLMSRQLTYAEACSWRQDWGLISCHPMSVDGMLTVAA
jgi:transposase-like protein